MFICVFSSPCLQARKDVSTVEDPFDAPTYNIPEKPVTFTEGASYSLIILAGLGIAAAAAYGVFKELIFEPKEYDHIPAQVTCKETSLGLSIFFIHFPVLVTEFKVICVFNRYKIFGKALDRIKNDSEVCSYPNIYLLMSFYVASYLAVMIFIA